MSMTIKIYTTPICAYCNMAKEYFKSKGFAYEEISLIGNPAAQQEMLAKAGQLAVPVLDINGKIVIGFNRQAIDEALK